MEKIINFKNPNELPKKDNKPRNILRIVIIIILAMLIMFAILYASITPVRKFADKYIFHKIVSEEKLAAITLEYDSNVNVIGYNKYICVLAENNLKYYNTSGEMTNEIKLEVSNPIYNTNNRYLAISEKNSSKFYLISDSKILWQKEVDGVVNKIDVNQNGYVSVILTGTTYRSVIVTYDSKGNELFKTYLSSTTALDATVSPDNNYLAFAEINTTGTILQSNVKIISVAKAKEKDRSSDYITYAYEAPQNSLITNIEYKSKNKLVCMYDTEIHVITNDKDEEVMKLQEDNKKINNADIKLSNYIYRAVEQSTGLFQANTVIEMMNIDNKRENVYTVEGVAKNIECANNVIAVNLGQEVEFFNTNGWLVKEYKSSQDIQKIAIANGIAGIIYKDKVDIINL